MTDFSKRTTLALAASFALATGLVAGQQPALARSHHKVHRAAPAAAQPPAPRQQGVAGYFGPGAYGPPGLFAPAYGYGYYGPPRGDLGFALLGALNGGGFRGFVECGNYYARYPGAYGF